MIARRIKMKNKRRLNLRSPKTVVPKDSREDGTPGQTSEEALESASIDHNNKSMTEPQRGDKG